MNKFVLLGLLALAAVVVTVVRGIQPDNNSPPPSLSPTPSVKEFTLQAADYSYDLKEIKVKQGDKVKITLDNTGGFHDWVLEEFNAATREIQAGQSETIEFTADRVGTFEYYCSVGNHRQMGMVGQFIVE